MILSPRRMVSKLKPTRAFRSAPGGILPFRSRQFPPAPLVIRRPPPKVYGEIGPLQVRLASSKGDLRRAQKLRYQVFYEEMSAIPDVMTMMQRRDEDSYDPICDHLLVIDRGRQEKKRRRWPLRPRVVGTYRALRQDVAELYDGFYTQGEYDVASLIEAKRQSHHFVEVGRSCVLKPYRNRRTVELLWHGVWTYVRQHGGNVMIGCASFPGTDPQQHAMALSYLYHYALAPEDWRVKAHPHLRVDMDMMPASEINARAAIRAMPPLVKGYLRLGAYIGDGAVIDHQFGTTDVLIIVPTEAIDRRYLAHFGAPDEFTSSLANGSQRLM